MQRQLAASAILIAVAACGGGGTSGLLDGGPDTPTITAVEPDHAPVGGGTRVVLTGSGFLYGGAPPNRVLIGGVEATAAGVIDDDTLEVVVPAGVAEGDAEVTLFNQNGYASAIDVFRYNALPTITSVTPGEVVYNATSTQMTITGTGFTADDAGIVRVFLDDTEALDVEVVSDTTITFTATAGAALSRPDIRVVNDNGIAPKNDGFRYVPATADGLLVFPSAGENFAVYFDPATLNKIPIAAVDTSASGFQRRIRSVFLDSTGEFWAQARSGEFGRLDMTTQRVLEPVTGLANYSSIGRLGDAAFAIERNSRFGSLDLASGRLTGIGPAIPCCSSFALAANAGGTMFLVAAGQISTVDTITGVRGTPATLSPNVHVTDMRFFNGTLYASSNAGNLVTINPTSGATAVVTSFAVKLNSIEIFQ